MIHYERQQYGPKNKKTLELKGKVWELESGAEIDEGTNDEIGVSRKIVGIVGAQGKGRKGSLESDIVRGCKE